MNYKLYLYLFGCLSFLICSCKTNFDPLRPVHSYEWQTSTPEDNGLDPEILNAAADTAEKVGFIYSLLIVRNDRLVFESYFQGFGQLSAFNIRSVSKSFISALVGIAVERNYIQSPHDQTMMSFLPDYAGINPDQRINQILLIHLLTMRAGFDYNDRDAHQFFSGNNWILSTLQLPLIHDPGSVWNYATPLTHMLSVILTRTTNSATLDFANQNLFTPIGISVRQWTRDPQGYYFGGSEMFFTSRDLARFGSLYLHSGELDGKRILPAVWIDQSFQDYAEKENWNWGAFKSIGYGYLWWMAILNDLHVFFALGYGGQYIFVVPQLDMVIVSTCDPYILNYDVADSHEQWISYLMSDYILAAVTDFN